MSCDYVIPIELSPVSRGKEVPSAMQTGPALVSLMSSKPPDSKKEIQESSTFSLKALILDPMDFPTVYNSLT